MVVIKELEVTGTSLVIWFGELRMRGEWLGRLRLTVFEP